jgi:hypothetical protein
MHADTVCNTAGHHTFDVYDLVWPLSKDWGHDPESGIALRVRLYLGDLHGR